MDAHDPISEPTLLRPETAHLELTRSALSGRLSEEDALRWMVLSHTHEIHIRVDSVDGNWQRHEYNGAVVLHALTQRGVADVISQLWCQSKQLSDGPEDVRNSYVHWYWQYNTQVPYEIWECVPDLLRPHVAELRDRLSQDSRVVAIVPEN